MRMITAILRPYILDDMREGLDSIGISGITITEVKGFGRQKGHTELYRGSEHQIDFLPKIKLEVIIGNDKVDTVIETIVKVAKTGKVGDGKIFVSNVERVVRIRTEEEDNNAL